MRGERPMTAGFAIKALSNQIKRYMDSHVTQKWNPPLTGMQHGILGFISRHPDRDIFQRDIEAEFNIRRSTATGILQLMEKNGLLKREGVPYDARLKKLVLTQKAYDIHQQIFEEILEMEQYIIRGISEEDLAAFFRVAETIAKNIEQ